MKVRHHRPPIDKRGISDKPHDRVEAPNRIAPWSSRRRLSNAIGPSVSGAGFALLSMGIASIAS